MIERLGIDPSRPSVVFVGRITRQKGLPYLLRACHDLPPETQLVLLAGAPDTPEIARRGRGAGPAAAAARDGTGVIWVQEMLPKHEVIQVLTHATVFVCPSIYEPMGIVNLEAMACETAVVATATGGIPEVVADGETGLLVPIEQVAGRHRHAGRPGQVRRRPGRHDDPAARATRRGPSRWAWPGGGGRSSSSAGTAIAEETMEVYRSVL